MAIAVLAIVVVFISGDLTNIAQTDRAEDRTLEIAAADYFLGVMKADPGFWANGNDWSTGPSTQCLAPLGPYTDPGPSPSPTWHQMPTPPPGCPDFPFASQGAPQPVASGQPPASPVGNAVQYMWNASVHRGDPFVADLTVWVRRDESSPNFEYHAIRYQYPQSQTPTPIPTPTPTQTPTAPPTETPTPHPTQPPTPTPSPTPVGI